MKVPDPLRFVPDKGGGEGITQHDPRGSVAVKVAHKPKPVDHHARPEPEKQTMQRGRNETDYFECYSPVEV